MIVLVAATIHQTMALLQFQLLKKVVPAISGLPDQFAVHGAQAFMTRRSRTSARSFAALIGLGLCGFFVLSAKPAMAAATACTPQAPFTSCVAYTYSGGNQTFAVPAGTASIDVKVWGAGGGGGNTVYGGGEKGGGGGGFAQATIAVISTETLNLTVGQGGMANSTVATFGGGGAGGTGASAKQQGSSGGGLSGIWRGTALTDGNQLVIAGSGGGMSPGSPGGATGPYGGPGGGATGGQDTSPTLSGRGGTQTAGGAAASTNSGCVGATTPGSKFAGGKGANVTSFEGGGGGGSGWFGGGGGKCQANGNTTQNGDGGGGSGYINGVGVTNASMISGGPATGGFATAGTAGVAGGNTDPQYVSGIGVGGNIGSGGNGYIVIQYGMTVAEPFTVTKTSSTIGDPINTTDNPKAIPGSTVRYCIIVTNPNSVSATSVTVTDPVPPNLTFFSGSMRSGAGTSCANATTVEDHDNTGPDESDPIGMSYSGSTVTGTTASLAPSSSIVMTFGATVN